MVDATLTLPDWVMEAIEQSAQDIVTPDLPIIQDNIPLAEQLINWIETEFYVPELSGPMILFPYQKAVLREAFRQDADGKFVYDFILWGDIKKSIKSSIAAAVVLFRTLTTAWGSFTIVANDLKQADSRVFFYIKRAIELNPRLKLFARATGYKINCSNHATIEAIPVDPNGEAGGGSDMVEYTELHGFSKKAALKLWTETTIPPAKHGYAQRWADTYAGMSGESPILEPIYDQVCKPENLIDLGIEGLQVYAKDRILALWNTVPRLPWQTKEYYASEAQVLTPSEFDRVHGNKWSASENAFVPGQWWDACDYRALGLDGLPALDKYKEIAVGIDAAVSGDCFGIVAVSRDGDNVIVRYARQWTPPKNGKLIYSNPEDENDDEYPEGVLRWLAKEFHVVVYGYDPYQLHNLCTNLMLDGVGLFEEIKQGEPRLEADKQLFDVIRERRIIHDNDPDLTAHIKNANRHEDPQSHQLRIVKRANHLKIDLAVSLSMATYKAYQYLSE